MSERIFMAGKTIAKRVIAERIAEKLKLGQSTTLQVIQAFLDEVINELASGNRLEFRDFGVFETVERKPRIALNPKTLEKVPVERKLVVRFKVGRQMKQRVADYGRQSSAPEMGEAPVAAPEPPPPAPSI